DRVLDGVDLIPYVTGEATGVPHETLFWRQGYHQSVRHKDWKLIRSKQPTTGEQWEDVVWLFDLAVDPTEQVNLAAQRQDKVVELEKLLAAHNAEQAPPMWPSVVDMVQPVDKDGTQPYVKGDEYMYFPN
ncbi:MAG TPA: sulfatase, partial [Gammaproteobacteria bacterium]|nr:sulfatase [Gammaproteobacteria bacterium]